MPQFEAVDSLEDQMYPVSYTAETATEGRNRLTTFFRYFIAIPWLIVLAFYGIAAFVAVVIAWFALVFTGRYPEGLYNFNAGYLRMATRVNSFIYLMTDEFPSFGGGEDPEYPVRVGVAPPLDMYSRVKAFFRLIVGIPVMILAYLMSLILSVLSFIAWFTIVFAAKFPDSLFDPARAANAYITRSSAYFLLMTEDWPPFSLDGSEVAPAGEISSEATSRQA